MIPKPFSKPRTAAMKGESSHSQSYPSNILRSLSLQPQPDWATLPINLVENVASRLTSRNDTNCFRGVCNYFRRLLFPPSKTLFPHSYVEIPAPIGSTPSGRGHYLLRESTIYSVEPREKVSDELQIDSPWIMKVEEFETPGVRLKDVLSRFHFTNLCSDELPNPLDLFKIRLKELTKSYHLELFVKEEEDDAHLQADRGRILVTFFLQKVVITAWPDVPQVGFAVMALHDGGALHVWRKDEKYWNAIDNPNAEISTFIDILYVEKMFYVLDDSGHTFAVDPLRLTVAEVAGPVPNLGAGMKYLAKSGGHLVMVYKYLGQNYPMLNYSENLGRPDYPVRVRLYILNKESCSWVKLTNELHDQVIFVGEDASFSLSADKLPGRRGNLVYLSDIVFSGEANNFPGANVGVFNLDDENGTPEPISTSKTYHNMLWPPPEWLKARADPLIIQLP